VDAQLRELERKAATGDGEAATKLKRLRARIDPPKEPSHFARDFRYAGRVVDSCLFPMIMPEANIWFSSYTVAVRRLHTPTQIDLRVNGEIVSSMLVDHNSTPYSQVIGQYAMGTKQGDVVDLRIRGDAEDIHAVMEFISV